MVAVTLHSSKPKKNYLSVAFKLDQWEILEPIYKELLKRPIQSMKALEQWILDRNEVSAVIEEEFGWRYIQFTTNTNDRKAAKQYEYYIKNITPNVTSYEFQLNEKLVASPYLPQLDSDTYYIYIRAIRNDVQIYRKKNVQRFAEERLQSKKYGVLMASMNVEISGMTYTLQQANALLELSDREKREEAFRRSSERMLQDKENFEQILDDLLVIRHQVAQEANFANYRDYKFQQLGRFDYTAEDCFNFQESIQEEILPLLTSVHQRRKKHLGLDHFRPWDLAATSPQHTPLQPFKNQQDLIEKATQVLKEIDPFFGSCIKIMRQIKHLDLESRNGKRPGGYNMPLAVTGVPFIFMNISHSVVDMRTFMHESGHAVHSFLTNDFSLITAKQPPSEIAELAAMTMELLSMDKWHHFFEKEEDCKRAKIWLLENILQLLPWIAIIDRFQHWIYTHPKHHRAERKAAWLNILNDFSTSIMDRNGLEETVAYSWHRQLHLFEVPFYYIEYGMAQLGAIAIWKRYKEEGQVAIDDYINALKLGYSKSIPEVYAEAGIAFDFSRAYVKDLALFLKNEIKNLIEE